MYLLLSAHQPITTDSNSPASELELKSAATNHSCIQLYIVQCTISTITCCAFVHSLYYLAKNSGIRKLKIVMNWFESLFIYVFMDIWIMV